MLMDECQEISEKNDGIEIIDPKLITSILSYGGEFVDDEVDIFNMTSLSTLVFLSRREDDIDRPGREDDFRRLSLAYERIDTFPIALLPQFSETLLILDLTNNKFSNLDFLAQLRQLTTLICDHNPITSETVIPYMPRLQLFWINFCKISELYPWARKLHESCPSLRFISLMGNTAAPSYLNGGTFYEYIQYRLFMIATFPKLEHLDDRPVTEDQKEESERLYRRPLLERLVKRQNLVPACLRNVSGKLGHLLKPTEPIAIGAPVQMKNTIV